MEEKTTETSAPPAVLSFLDEAKKLKDGFVAQLAQSEKALAFHKGQLSRLEKQMDQIKGAIYALDQITQPKEKEE